MPSSHPKKIDVFQRNKQSFLCNGRRLAFDVEENILNEQKKSGKESFRLAVGQNRHISVASNFRRQRVSRESRGRYRPPVDASSGRGRLGRLSDQPVIYSNNTIYLYYPDNIQEYLQWEHQTLT